MVYTCTRRGNFIQRTEINGLQLQNQAMMGMMGNMNNGQMMMNPMMMNPQMMMNPMMGGMMMMPPITAGGVAPSIAPDNSGNSNGPATW